MEDKDKEGTIKPNDEEVVYISDDDLKVDIYNVEEPVQQCARVYRSNPPATNHVPGDILDRPISTLLTWGGNFYCDLREDLAIRATRFFFTWELLCYALGQIDRLKNIFGIQGILYIKSLGRSDDTDYHVRALCTHMDSSKVTCGEFRCAANTIFMPAMQRLGIIGHNAQHTPCVLKPGYDYPLKWFFNYTDGQKTFDRFGPKLSVSLEAVNRLPLALYAGTMEHRFTAKEVEETMDLSKTDPTMIGARFIRLFLKDENATLKDLHDFLCNVRLCDAAILLREEIDTFFIERRAKCVLQSANARAYYITCEKNLGYDSLLKPVAAPAPVIIQQPQQATPAAASAPDPVQPKEKDKSCVICLDAKKTHVAKECGHKACCEACTKNLTTCPICRAPTTWIKVFKV